MSLGYSSSNHLPSKLTLFFPSLSSHRITSLTIFYIINFIYFIFFFSFNPRILFPPRRSSHPSSSLFLSFFSQHFHCITFVQSLTVVHMTCYLLLPRSILLPLLQILYHPHLTLFFPLCILSLLHFINYHTASILIYFTHLVFICVFCFLFVKCFIVHLTLLLLNAFIATLYCVSPSLISFILAVSFFIKVYLVSSSSHVLSFLLLYFFLTLLLHHFIKSLATFNYIYFTMLFITSVYHFPSSSHALLSSYFTSPSLPSHPITLLHRLFSPQFLIYTPKLHKLSQFTVQYVFRHPLRHSSV